MRVEIGHPPKEITLYNHNRLLREYEGCIGVKTGFTKKAGRCLVSAARRDGITLICVTLGVYDDWNVHKRLLDRCFEMVTPFALTPSLLPETLPVAGGQGGYCTVGLLEEGVVGRAEGDASLEEELFLPPFAYPNMGPGQVLGWVRWRLDGKELARLPVGILEVTYDAGQGSG